MSLQEAANNKRAKRTRNQDIRKISGDKKTKIKLKLYRKTRKPMRQGAMGRQKLTQNTGNYEGRAKSKNTRWWDAI